MRAHTYLALAFVIPATLMVGPALAQEGGDEVRAAHDTFTYFGELRRLDEPYTGTADLTFTLWDQATDGAQIAAEQRHEDVMVIDGMFQVKLTFPQGALADRRWLEIAVRAPAGEGAFTTLSPRQTIGSVEDQLREEQSDVSERSPTEDESEVDRQDDSALADDPSSPGPGARGGHAIRTQDDRDDSSPGGGDDDQQIRTLSAGPSPWTDDSNGIHYDSGHVGIGTDSSPVWALSVRTSPGDEVAIFSRTDEPGGWAYFSRATGPNGRGIFGTATHPSGTNFGVYGAASGDEGRGVFGWAKSTTGFNYGVYGQTDSTSPFATGVYGLVSSASPGGVSTAVRGQNNGTGGSGIGVWGSQAGSGWGVLGQTVDGIGVYGLVSEPGGWAGYFEGGRNYFDGSVGVGITSPADKLHLGEGQIRIDADNNGSQNGGGLELRRNGTSGLMNVIGIYDDDGTFKAHTHYGLTGDRWYFTNNGIGNTTGVYLSVGGVLWTSTSDERLKADIRDVNYGLDQVLALRPRDFVWKENGLEDTGFIAQEVYEVFPQAVTTTQDDEPGWGVTYAKLTPLLVAAIQELATTIEARDAKIAAQQRQIDSLTDRLADLEALVTQLAHAQEGAER